MKKNRSNSVVGLLLVAAVIYGGVRLFAGSDDPAAKRGNVENPDLVIDRLWIDSDPNKPPDAPTDYVNAFIMLDFMPVGIFQKASGYHLELEVFEFERNKGQVRLRFPQRDAKRRFKYEIRSCNDVPPFDLCLTLNKNPWFGPKTYYSMREWEQSPKQLRAIAQRLATKARATVRPNR